MDLYEYQARDLFRRHGIPVLDDAVATTPDEARDAAERLLAQGSRLLVIKAQVKTGGRGKAGGVKLAHSADEAYQHAQAILGMDIKGHTVRRVLIADAADIDAEYYVSFLLDRANRQYLALCSRQGGMDIETLAREHPEALARVAIDPLTGVTPDKAREILDEAGFRPADEPAGLYEQLETIVLQLWDTFATEDATLVEVNPLSLCGDGVVRALDAKVSLDNNADFRHPERSELHTDEATDPLEARAAEVGLNYVRLEGDVGVLGNGAGLVMSTLDVVAGAGEKHGGMRPANFLDLGGGSSADVMAAGLEIVASDPQVRAILVNVFGGITSCDTIAQGIITALDHLGRVDKPIVVRLDGNNADLGRSILAEAQLPDVVMVDTMDGAADVVTDLAHKRIVAEQGAPAQEEAAATAPGASASAPVQSADTVTEA